MAWDRRGYYTRSVRVGRRVGKQYFGRGAGAELAAALDELREQERQAAATARQAEQERWQAAQTPLLELTSYTELLLGALLTVHGFHQHDRGAWRRYRHGPENSTPP